MMPACAMRSTTCALLVCLLTVPLLADEKKAPARPVGTWKREVDDRTVTFTIKDDTLTVQGTYGDDSMTAMTFTRSAFEGGVDVAVPA